METGDRCGKREDARKLRGPEQQNHAGGGEHPEMLLQDLAETPGPMETVLFEFFPGESAGVE